MSEFNVKLTRQEVFMLVMLFNYLEDINDAGFMPEEQILRDKLELLLVE